MPHIILKLVTGRSAEQKKRIAAELTKAMMATADCTEDAVSVSIEDVAANDWVEQVYKPDIIGKAGLLFKEPGYDPLA